MPKALQTCSHPGCGALVKSGLCTDHARARQSVYRNPEWEKLYHTAAWKRIRARQLAKEPWCAECLVEGSYTPATQADHIEPHRGDRIKFFRGALQSLCDSHHSAKTAREVGFVSGGMGGDKSGSGGETAQVAVENSLYGIGIKKVER